MQKRAADLEEGRKAFNSFAASVLPSGTFNRDTLGHADLAQLIDDEVKRREFCRLAIAMLDANIAYYRPEATLRPKPEPNQITAVASALVIAGIAYSLKNAASALIAAGVCYGVIAAMTVSRTRAAQVEVQAHNDSVSDWAETISDWESERDALRLL